MLHDATVQMLNDDARRTGRGSIDGIVIELNDPFRVAARDDNYDPFDRAMIWDRWGYGRLCFPYVQPALSEDQDPVTCLLLAMKPIAPELQHQVPASLVTEVLKGYLRWAMRIDDPQTDPVFLDMQEFLSSRSSVSIEPLSHYVGRDPTRPLTIKSITATHDPAFTIATDLYARVFPPGPTVIDVRMFMHALEWGESRNDLHYHLWAFAPTPEEPIAGMASFFVMPRFAFGGYLAFEEPLRGTGRAGVALKRMEERTIRDEPGALKHYAECQPNSAEEAILLTLGFKKVEVRYCQPPAIDEQQFGAGEGPELTLLVKWLGKDFGRNQLSRDEFLADLEVWLEDVYRVADPKACSTFRIAQATFGQVRDRGHD
jgi:hypothetical protein